MILQASGQNRRVGGQGSREVRPGDANGVEEFEFREKSLLGVGEEERRALPDELRDLRFGEIMALQKRQDGVRPFAVVELDLLGGNNGGFWQQSTGIYEVRDGERVIFR